MTTKIKYAKSTSHIATAYVAPHAARDYCGQAVVATVLGLHSRPSTLISKCATQLKYDDCQEIILNCRDISVNGKSIMGVMSLQARYGEKILVTVKGNGSAQVCLDELVGVIQTDLDKPGNYKHLLEKFSHQHY